MELDRIEKLLEKYFEATATVAEEETLRDYFKNENIPVHLKQYAPMFQYFSVAKEERFTKQVPLKPRKSYLEWASVAAVAVLVFGIYFGNEYSEKQEQKKAEYAYQETKKALSLLAANFERGTEKVAYLNEFEATKEKIYNNN
ncbi:hypothetical protein KCTC52924_00059 [Arenibacter antarcticus]|uniref:Anti-sigma factor n=1 Tax=Arenibacter antarcticus TaxID=2040469 RepID=A0ABW5VPI4_9FLAO|nr:hypothetical protein [Arenibacter sp. H213]MCM4169172.1 hypothetical protein [Arenibacter sp. H213]